MQTDCSSSYSEEYSATPYSELKEFIRHKIYSYVVRIRVTVMPLLCLSLSSSRLSLGFPTKLCLCLVSLIHATDFIRLVLLHLIIQNLKIMIFHIALFLFSRQILGFHCIVVEVFVLEGCYTASVGRWLPVFWDNIRPTLKVDPCRWERYVVPIRH